MTCRSWQDRARRAGWAWLFAAGVAGAGAQPAALARAQQGSGTFAGGCFWCVESDFDKGTGHAEAVRIEFDPSKLSCEGLLKICWRSIDPTPPDRPLCGIGSPYRTAIFVHDEAQAQQARASLAARQRSEPFSEPIVTTLEPAGPFDAAEKFHQDDYLKNPLRYRCYGHGCGRDARLQQLWGAAK